MTNHAQLGVVGAGQLGRMMYQASIPLGIDLKFLASGPDDAAAQIAPHVRFGSAQSQADLQAFAAMCDVITFEHEIVNTDALAGPSFPEIPVRPSASALSVVANKIRMRQVVQDAGVPVPPWRIVTGRSEAADALCAWPAAVLKLSTGGYDGRGVFLVEDVTTGLDLAVTLLESGGPLLVEPKLAFESEAAVIVARRPGGETVVYDPVTTIQIDGQCRQVNAPADLDGPTSRRARHLAVTLADHLDAVGLVAVEMFVLGEELLVNELAVRPHNTGHHTIDASITSQFENHVRAVLDMPLGDPSLHTPAVMVNVIGDREGTDPRGRLSFATALDPAARIHLYGKAPRPDRKIGHVTVCDEDPVRGAQRAWRVVEALGGDIPDEIRELMP